MRLPQDELPPPVASPSGPSSNSNSNTTIQIQNIFAEVQSQLPSVVFDNDDDEKSISDDECDAEANAIQQQYIAHDLFDTNSRLLNPYPEDLLESLLKGNDSFISAHPRLPDAENQKPPSVELQMRASPNPLEKESLNENASTNKSNLSNHSQFLSMDLLNGIDFEKLNTTCDKHSRLPTNVSRSRPQPTNSRAFSNSPAKDDVVLQRLVQHASKFGHESTAGHSNHIPPQPFENTGFRNLERALHEAEERDARRKRIMAPETERKTIYLDLRQSEKEKKRKEEEEKTSVSVINRILQRNPTNSKSDSSSDDDENNNMLWFEKRREMKNKLSKS
ncbi:unnamed protein product [Didymodactylos carnosus]|uniref:Uncharacterized protein n=1 Tax=Didymodactylos carnosus TaxID=1234261 RepID=A0A813XL52_9BILA|nr:unnamed protein product [Didymodactylos carnosus]CAF0871491.1 unnamed protein product [Didymodactylos carnosus]CAF3603509.1 unnamed protein product [Didymodactylos carnosus]CAF3658800.1 unnamed protein product [Didymodactylos carnosus]